MDPAIEDEMGEPPNNPPPFPEDDDEEYPMSLANSEDLKERELPGVVQMVLPIPLRNDAAERERTPRRDRRDADEEGGRASVATMVEPSADGADLVMPLPEDRGRERERSPKRKGSTKAEEPSEKSQKTEASSSARAAAPDTEQAVKTPVPHNDDDVLHFDVDVERVVGVLPGGWKCVDGGFELDDAFYTSTRPTGKGRSIPRS